MYGMRLMRRGEVAVPIRVRSEGERLEVRGLFLRGKRGAEITGSEDLSLYLPASGEIVLKASDVGKMFEFASALMDAAETSARETA